MDGGEMDTWSREFCWKILYHIQSLFSHRQEGVSQMWTGWVKNHLKCAGIGCGLPECFLSSLSINKPIYELLPLPQCFSFLQESLGPFMIFSEISNPYNFSGRFCVRTKWMMAKRKADNHFICTIHVKKYTLCQY